MVANLFRRIFHVSGPLISGALLLSSSEVANGQARPSGEWSDYPECDRQYEQDTTYCNRFRKKQNAAKCRANRSERLAYCNKTEGQTGHPPRYANDEDD